MRNHTQNTALTDTLPGGISLAAQGMYWLRYVKPGMENQGSVYSDNKPNKCTNCGGKFAQVKTPEYPVPVPRCVSCNYPPVKLRVSFNIPGQGRKPIRKYKGKRLTTLSMAVSCLEDIRQGILQKNLDVTQFMSSKDSEGHKTKAYLDLYLEKQRKAQLKGRCAGASVKSTESLVRLYLKPYFGEMFITDITYAHLDDFMSVWKPDTSERQKSKALEVLRPVLKEARKSIPSMVMPEFPPLVKSKQTTERITDEEQWKVFDHVRNHRAAIGMCLIYGLRPCEVRALQWNDINWKTMQFTISRHFSECENGKGTYGKKKQILLMPGRKSAYEGEGSTASLTLDIFPDFLDLLREIPRSLDSTDFVFGKRKGIPLYESAMRKEWNRARDDAGIKKISFYCGTKHSTFTHLHNQGGVDMDTLKNFAGHTDPRTTAKYAKGDSITASKRIGSVRKLRVRNVCANNSDD